MRKIAQHALLPRIVLFGEQSDIVAQGQQSVEQLFRLLHPADQAIGVHQPEAAGEESAFAGGQAVLRAGCAIALHEPIDEEIAFDRLNRRAHPRIGGGQESNGRYQQESGIELLWIRKPERSY